MIEYILIPVSQLIIPAPPAVSRSFLYVCISIPALELGSSVQFSGDMFLYH